MTNSHVWADKNLHVEIVMGMPRLLVTNSGRFAHKYGPLE
jgi:hypothetical protein